jgi:hypothetical protein
MRTFVVTLALALTSGLAAAGGAALFLSITPVIKEPDLQWLRQYTATKTLPKPHPHAGIFIYAFPQAAVFGSMDRDKQWGDDSANRVSY